MKNNTPKSIVEKFLFKLQVLMSNYLKVQMIGNMFYQMKLKRLAKVQVLMKSIKINFNLRNYI